MRLCFLFATKAASDLDSLPEGVKVLTPANGNGLTIRIAGLEYPESDLLLRFLGARTISGSKWRLWLVLPCSIADPLMQGARAARFIRRLAIARPAAVRGPWSIKQFSELFPALADAVLYPHACDKDGNDLGKIAGSELQPPLAIAGDVAPELPKADYRPTDAEAAADTEPDPKTIIAAAQARAIEDARPK